MANEQLMREIIEKLHYAQRAVISEWSGHIAGDTVKSFRECNEYCRQLGLPELQPDEMMQYYLDEEKCDD